MSEDREDMDLNRVLTDDELWGETGRPVMREPDFSDVRKKIFNPWKIVLFVILSVAFWCLYLFYFN